ncbi:DNA methyltransferase, partial [Acinetobacter baumannii]|uniref:DNA methyltransferase n=1 Tax=Acinetobacter baumannii TaxID=470 RepID=UPI0038924328
MAKSNVSEWGTFKDSLKAPVHSWFTYPAGFSFKAVEHTIKKHNLKPGIDTIYDPFMGSGTTNIVAKVMGLNSVGVEAHPFVYNNITLSKLTWNLESNQIHNFLSDLDFIEQTFPDEEEIKRENEKHFPELVRKCYLPQSLYALWTIRQKIQADKNLGNDERRFLKAALICSLRDISIAATGWPYIAPNKIKITSMSKNATETYIKKSLKMLNDLKLIQESASSLDTEHRAILGDSRSTDIPSESVDHIFTSPPYLNNFDYADRTRLEMYFTGDAENWSDISKNIRTKLMTSATTQISRTDPRYILSEEMKSVSPKVYDFILDAQ